MFTIELNSRFLANSGRTTSGDIELVVSANMQDPILSALCSRQTGRVQESNGTELGICLTTPFDCQNSRKIRAHRSRSSILEIGDSCSVHNCSPHGGANDHAARIGSKSTNAALNQLSLFQTRPLIDQAIGVYSKRVERQC